MVEDYKVTGDEDTGKILNNKILLYSDCIFYGGCENMVTILMNSKRFDMDFIYRQTDIYDKGLHEQVPSRNNVYPLKIKDSMTIISNLFGTPRNRFIRNFIWILFYLPLRFYCITSNIRPIYKFMKKNNYDLIHINNGGYPGAESAYSAVIAAKMAGIPNITYMVNNQALGYDRAFRFADFLLDKFTARAVTKFITASKSAKKILCDVLKIPAGQVVNIYNGIKINEPDEDRKTVFDTLGLDESVFLVTIVANIETRKGILFAIQAIERINKSANSGKIKLAIRGEGPIRPEIEAYLNTNEVKNVFFVDRQRNISNLMVASDVLLLPSIGNEDLPNVISEGMGLGKVFISTTVAGIPEQIIDKETGLICQPGSVDEIEEAILFCYNNPEKLKEMEIKSKEKFLSDFESRIAVRGYGELFKQLTSE